MQRNFLVALPVLIVTVAIQPATAAVLFSDQMTSGAAWGLNLSGADFAATFGYNYSADGIPEAPNSQGGDAATSGLKLQANIIDPAAAAFFTAYPIGQNFTGTYRLRFDAWMNFDADEVASGSSNGTTEFLGGGIGYNNTSIDVGSGAQAIATGDGGSGSDWRAFKEGPLFIASADMAAGSRNGSDPYYSDFLPAVAPPGAQGQSASGIAGSPGFQWITWQITVLGDQVLMDIIKPGGDELRIVTIDCGDTTDGSTGCATDGNISLFYADYFSSVSPRPDLTFGIIDNVVVEDGFVVAAPEPATLAILGLGLAGLGFARRSKAA